MEDYSDYRYSSSDEEQDFLQTSEKEHSIKTPGVSELTSTVEFEKKCIHLFHKHPYDSLAPSEFVSHVSEKMGISESRVEALKKMCNPELLSNKNKDSTHQDPPTSTSSSSSSESPLNFIKNPAQVISYFSKCQEFSISPPNMFNKDVTIRESPGDMRTEVPGNTTLMWVDVFHPVKKVRDHGFLLLANQLLTELKDTILCPNDYMWTEDVSDKPEAVEEPARQPQKMVVPQCVFFFINNTFYNDRRVPCEEDISSRIIKWTQEKPDRIEMSPALDHYTSVDMAGVRFDQLQLRLGFPYLYHHGGCDHLIMFRDIRLFNPRADARYVEMYPRLVFFWTKIRRHPCCVCEGEAVWLTCDDELVPESPSFFCHNCFEKFHYTADHQKVCRFKAYRYQVPDNPLLLTNQ